MFKFSKHIRITLLFITLLSFKPNTALAGGGFTVSCVNLVKGQFPSVFILQAQCFNYNTQLVTSHIDLNLSITNNRGHLAWQKNGGFVRSVRNCDIGTFSSQWITRLSCEASDGRGSWIKSIIKLDDHIANINGNLTVLDGF